MRTAKTLPPAYLDRNSYQPLYLQLAQHITGCIKNGDLKCGDRLPSELDLVKTLNISRMTVRLAMDELLDHGFVYREQGRGTYIAEPQMKGVRGFSSFTEDITSRGLSVSTKVLTLKKTISSPILMNEMRIDKPIEVVEIERLRLIRRHSLGDSIDRIAGCFRSGIGDRRFTPIPFFSAEKKLPDSPGLDRRRGQSSNRKSERIRFIEYF